MSDPCVLEHDHHTLALAGLLLCGKHRHALDDLTREIGMLVVDTCRIIDGGAPTEGSPKTRRVKQPEAPAPGDLGIMALYDRRTWTAPVKPTTLGEWDESQPVVPVLKVIASWLVMVADTRPLTETRHRTRYTLIIRHNTAQGFKPWDEAYTAPMTLPDSVLAQLDMLSRHHEWLAAHDAIDDYWSEMRDIRQHLRNAVRDHTHKRVGTCDLPTEGERQCGGALLVENGSDVIRCASCRSAWTTPQEQARLAVRIG